MGYEYKVYHKETGEEIHEENFSQYFSQYIALDSDGDLVEIDSRDAVLVSVIDFAYIKFNKTDEYEAKAKLMDNIYAELKKRDGEAIDLLNVDYYDFGVYVARTIEEYESECDSNA